MLTKIADPMLQQQHDASAGGTSAGAAAPACPPSTAGVSTAAATQPSVSTTGGTAPTDREAEATAANCATAETASAAQVGVTHNNNVARDCAGAAVEAPAAESQGALCEAGVIAETPTHYLVGAAAPRAAGRAVITQVAVFGGDSSSSDTPVAAKAEEEEEEAGKCLDDAKGRSCCENDIIVGATPEVVTVLHADTRIREEAPEKSVAFAKELAVAAAKTAARRNKCCQGGEVTKLRNFTQRNAATEEKKTGMSPTDDIARLIAQQAAAVVAARECKSIVEEGGEAACGDFPVKEAAATEEKTVHAAVEAPSLSCKKSPEVAMITVAGANTVTTATAGKAAAAEVSPQNTPVRKEAAACMLRSVEEVRHDAKPSSDAAAPVGTAVAEGMDRCVRGRAAAAGPPRQTAEGTCDERIRKQRQQHLFFLGDGMKQKGTICKSLSEESPQCTQKQAEQHHCEFAKEQQQQQEEPLRPQEEQQQHHHRHREEEGLSSVQPSSANDDATCFSCESGVMRSKSVISSSAESHSSAVSASMQTATHRSDCQLVLLHCCGEDSVSEDSRSDRLCGIQRKEAITTPTLAAPSLKAGESASEAIASSSNRRTAGKEIAVDCGVKAAGVADTLQAVRENTCKQLHAGESASDVCHAPIPPAAALAEKKDVEVAGETLSAGKDVCMKRQGAGEEDDKELQQSAVTADYVSGSSVNCIARDVKPLREMETIEEQRSPVVVRQQQSSGSQQGISQSDELLLLQQQQKQAEEEEDMLVASTPCSKDKRLNDETTAVLNDAAATQSDVRVASAEAAAVAVPPTSCSCASPSVGLATALKCRNNTEECDKGTMSLAVEERGSSISSCLKDSGESISSGSGRCQSGSSLNPRSVSPTKKSSKSPRNSNYGDNYSTYNSSRRAAIQLDCHITSNSSNKSNEERDLRKCERVTAAAADDEAAAPAATSGGEAFDHDIKKAGTETVILVSKCDAPAASKTGAAATPGDHSGIFVAPVTTATATDTGEASVLNTSATSGTVREASTFLDAEQISEKSHPTPPAVGTHEAAGDLNVSEEEQRKASTPTLSSTERAMGAVVRSTVVVVLKKNKDTAPPACEAMRDSQATVTTCDISTRTVTERKVCENASGLKATATNGSHDGKETPAEAKIGERPATPATDVNGHDPQTVNAEQEEEAKCKTKYTSSAWSGEVAEEVPEEVPAAAAAAARATVGLEVISPTSTLVAPESATAAVQVEEVLAAGGSTTVVAEAEVGSVAIESSTPAAEAEVTRALHAAAAARATVVLEVISPTSTLGAPESATAAVQVEEVLAAGGSGTVVAEAEVGSVAIESSTPAAEAEVTRALHAAAAEDASGNFDCTVEPLPRANEIVRSPEEREFPATAAATGASKHTEEPVGTAANTSSEVVAPLIDAASPASVEKKRKEPVNCLPSWVERKAKVLQELQRLCSQKQQTRAVMHKVLLELQQRRNFIVGSNVYEHDKKCTQSSVLSDNLHSCQDVARTYAAVRFASVLACGKAQYRKEHIGTGESRQREARQQNKQEHFQHGQSTQHPLLSLVRQSEKLQDTTKSRYHLAQKDRQQLLLQRQRECNKLPEKAALQQSPPATCEQQIIAGGFTEPQQETGQSKHLHLQQRDVEKLQRQGEKTEVPQQQPPAEERRYSNGLGNDLRERKSIMRVVALQAAAAAAARIAVSGTRAQFSSSGISTTAVSLVRETTTPLQNGGRHESTAAAHESPAAVHTGPAQLRTTSAEADLSAPAVITHVLPAPGAPAEQELEKERGESARKALTEQGQHRGQNSVAENTSTTVVAVRHTTKADTSAVKKGKHSENHKDATTKTLQSDTATHLNNDQQRNLAQQYARDLRESCSHQQHQRQRQEDAHQRQHCSTMQKNSFLQTECNPQRIKPFYHPIKDYLLERHALVMRRNQLQKETMMVERTSEYHRNLMQLLAEIRERRTTEGHNQHRRLDERLSCTHKRADLIGQQQQQQSQAQQKKEKLLSEKVAENVKQQALHQPIALKVSAVNFGGQSRPPPMAPTRPRDPHSGTPTETACGSAAAPVDQEAAAAQTVGTDEKSCGIPAARSKELQIDSSNKVVRGGHQVVASPPGGRASTPDAMKNRPIPIEAGSGACTSIAPPERSESPAYSSKSENVLASSMGAVNSDFTYQNSSKVAAGVAAGGKLPAATLTEAERRQTNLLQRNQEATQSIAESERQPPLASELQQKQEEKERLCGLATTGKRSPDKDHQAAWPTANNTAAVITTMNTTECLKVTSAVEHKGETSNLNKTVRVRPGALVVSPAAAALVSPAATDSLLPAGAAKTPVCPRRVKGIAALRSPHGTHVRLHSSSMRSPSKRGVQTEQRGSPSSPFVAAIRTQSRRRRKRMREKQFPSLAELTACKKTLTMVGEAAAIQKSHTHLDACAQHEGLTSTAAPAESSAAVEVGAAAGAAVAAAGAALAAAFTAAAAVRLVSPTPSSSHHNEEEAESVATSATARTQHTELGRVFAAADASEADEPRTSLLQTLGQIAARPGTERKAQSAPTSPEETTFRRVVVWANSSHRAVKKSITAARAEERPVSCRSKEPSEARRSPPPRTSSRQQVAPPQTAVRSGKQVTSTELSSTELPPADTKDISEDLRKCAEASLTLSQGTLPHESSCANPGGTPQKLSTSEKHSLQGQPLLLQKRHPQPPFMNSDKRAPSAAIQADTETPDCNAAVPRVARRRRNSSRIKGVFKSPSFKRTAGTGAPFRRTRVKSLQGSTNAKHLQEMLSSPEMKSRRPRATFPCKSPGFHFASHQAAHVVVGHNGEVATATPGGFFDADNSAAAEVGADIAATSDNVDIQAAHTGGMLALLAADVSGTNRTLLSWLSAHTTLSASRQAALVFPRTVETSDARGHAYAGATAAAAVATAASAECSAAASPSPRLSDKSFPFRWLQLRKGSLPTASATVRSTTGKQAPSTTGSLHKTTANSVDVFTSVRAPGLELSSQSAHVIATPPCARVPYIPTTAGSVLPRRATAMPVPVRTSGSAEERTSARDDIRAMQTREMTEVTQAGQKVTDQPVTEKNRLAERIEEKNGADACVSVEAEKVQDVQLLQPSEEALSREVFADAVHQVIEDPQEPAAGSDGISANIVDNGERVLLLTRGSSSNKPDADPATSESAPALREPLTAATEESVPAEREKQSVIEAARTPCFSVFSGGQQQRPRPHQATISGSVASATATDCDASAAAKHSEERGHEDKQARTIWQELFYRLQLRQPQQQQRLEQTSGQSLQPETKKEEERQGDVGPQEIRRLPMLVNPQSMERDIMAQISTAEKQQQHAQQHSQHHQEPLFRAKQVPESEKSLNTITKELQVQLRKPNGHNAVFHQSEQTTGQKDNTSDKIKNQQREIPSCENACQEDVCRKTHEKEALGGHQQEQQQRMAGSLRIEEGHANETVPQELSRQSEMKDEEHHGFLRSQMQTQEKNGSAESRQQHQNKQKPQQEKKTRFAEELHQLQEPSSTGLNHRPSSTSRTAIGAAHIKGEGVPVAIPYLCSYSPLVSPFSANTTSAAAADLKEPPTTVQEVRDKASVVSLHDDKSTKQRPLSAAEGSRHSVSSELPQQKCIVREAERAASREQNQPKGNQKHPQKSHSTTSKRQETYLGQIAAFSSSNSFSTIEEEAADREVATILKTPSTKVLSTPSATALIDQLSTVEGLRAFMGAPQRACTIHPQQGLSPVLCQVSGPQYQQREQQKKHDEQRRQGPNHHDKEKERCCLSPLLAKEKSPYLDVDESADPTWASFERDLVPRLIEAGKPEGILAQRRKLQQGSPEQQDEQRKGYLFQLQQKTDTVKQLKHQDTPPVCNGKSAQQPSQYGSRLLQVSQQQSKEESVVPLKTTSYRGATETYCDDARKRESRRQALAFVELCCHTATHRLLQTVTSPSVEDSNSRAVSTSTNQCLDIRQINDADKRGTSSSATTLTKDGFHKSNNSSNSPTVQSTTLLDVTSNTSSYRPRSARFHEVGAVAAAVSIKGKASADACAAGRNCNNDATKRSTGTACCRDDNTGAQSSRQNTSDGAGRPTSSRSSFRSCSPLENEFSVARSSKRLEEVPGGPTERAGKEKREDISEEVSVSPRASSVACCWSQHHRTHSDREGTCTTVAAVAGPDASAVAAAAAAVMQGKAGGPSAVAAQRVAQCTAVAPFNPYLQEQEKYYQLLRQQPYGFTQGPHSTADSLVVHFCHQDNNNNGPRLPPDYVTYWPQERQKALGMCYLLEQQPQYSESFRTDVSAQWRSQHHHQQQHQQYHSAMEQRGQMHVQHGVHTGPHQQPVILQTQQPTERHLPNQLMHHQKQQQHQEQQQKRNEMEANIGGTGWRSTWSSLIESLFPSRSVTPNPVAMGDSALQSIGAAPETLEAATDEASAAATKTLCQKNATGTVGEEATRSSTTYTATAAVNSLCSAAAVTTVARGGRPGGSKEAALIASSDTSRIPPSSSGLAAVGGVTLRGKAPATARVQDCAAFNKAVVLRAQSANSTTGPAANNPHCAGAGTATHATLGEAATAEAAHLSPVASAHPSAAATCNRTSFQQTGRSHSILTEQVLQAHAASVEGGAKYMTRDTPGTAKEGKGLSVAPYQCKSSSSSLLVSPSPSVRVLPTPTPPASMASALAASRSPEAMLQLQSLSNHIHHPGSSSDSSHGDSICHVNGGGSLQLSKRPGGGTLTTSQSPATPLVESLSAAAAQTEEPRHVACKLVASRPENAPTQRRQLLRADASAPEEKGKETREEGADTDMSRQLGAEGAAGGEGIIRSWFGRIFSTPNPLSDHLSTSLQAAADESVVTDWQKKRDPHGHPEKSGVGGVPSRGGEDREDREEERGEDSDNEPAIFGSPPGKIIERQQQQLKQCQKRQQASGQQQNSLMGSLLLGQLLLGDRISTTTETGQELRGQDQQSKTFGGSHSAVGRNGHLTSSRSDRNNRVCHTSSCSSVSLSASAAAPAGRTDLLPRTERLQQQQQRENGETHTPVEAVLPGGERSRGSRTEYVTSSARNCRNCGETEPRRTSDKQHQETRGPRSRKPLQSAHQGSHALTQHRQHDEQFLQKQDENILRQRQEDDDYLFALELQEQLNRESSSGGEEFTGNAGSSSSHHSKDTLSTQNKSRGRKNDTDRQCWAGSVSLAEKEADVRERLKRLQQQSEMQKLHFRQLEHQQEQSWLHAKDYQRRRSSAHITATAASLPRRASIASAVRSVSPNEAAALGAALSFPANQGHRTQDARQREADQRRREQLLLQQKPSLYNCQEQMPELQRVQQMQARLQQDKIDSRSQLRRQGGTNVRSGARPGEQIHLQPPQQQHRRSEDCQYHPNSGFFPGVYGCDSQGRHAQSHYRPGASIAGTATARPTLAQQHSLMLQEGTRIVSGGVMTDARNSVETTRTRHRSSNSGNRNHTTGSRLRSTSGNKCTTHPREVCYENCPGRRVSSSAVQFLGRNTDEIIKYQKLPVHQQQQHVLRNTQEELRYNLLQQVKQRQQREYTEQKRQQNQLDQSHRLLCIRPRRGRSPRLHREEAFYAATAAGNARHGSNVSYEETPYHKTRGTTEDQHLPPRGRSRERLHTQLHVPRSPSSVRRQGQQAEQHQGGQRGDLQRHQHLQQTEEAKRRWQLYQQQLWKQQHQEIPENDFAFGDLQCEDPRQPLQLSARIRQARSSDPSFSPIVLGPERHRLHRSSSWRVKSSRRRKLYNAARAASVAGASAAATGFAMAVNTVRATLHKAKESAANRRGRRTSPRSAHDNSSSRSRSKKNRSVSNTGIRERGVTHRHAVAEKHGHEQQQQRERDTLRNPCRPDHAWLQHNCHSSIHPFSPKESCTYMTCQPSTIVGRGRSQRKDGSEEATRERGQKSSKNERKTRTSSPRPLNRGHNDNEVPEGEHARQRRCSNTKRQPRMPASQQEERRISSAAGVASSSEVADAAGLAIQQKRRTTTQEKNNSRELGELPVQHRNCNEQRPPFSRELLLLRNERRELERETAAASYHQVIRDYTNSRWRSAAAEGPYAATDHCINSQPFTPPSTTERAVGETADTSEMPVVNKLKEARVAPAGAKAANTAAGVATQAETPIPEEAAEGLRPVGAAQSAGDLHARAVFGADLDGGEDGEFLGLWGGTGLTAEAAASSEAAEESV